MSQIRLITFDATNTLFKVCGSVGEVYAKTAFKYGIKTDAQQIDKNFKHAFKQLNTKFPNFGQTVGMPSQTWWNNVVVDSFKANHVECGILSKISSELYVNFTKKTHWRLFPDVLPVLQHFKNKGIKLGVISNFDERLPEIMTELAIQEYFSFILPSRQLQWYKPSPEIFHQAVSMVTSYPTEAIHIGDNLILDYEAAMHAGMDAYLLQRKPSDMKTNVPVNKIITDLKQLCNLI